MASDVKIGSGIPFSKAVRVGNYNLWRSRFRTKSEGVDKGQQMEIACVNVSTLDGTWKVQIPSTFEMYGIVCGLHDDMSSDDILLGANARKSLELIFSNMQYASLIGNGYFHRALMMCATAYAYPSVLEEGDASHAEFVEDFRKMVSDYLVWRKELSTIADKSGMSSDDMLRYDEGAETAQEIISEGAE